MLWTLIVVLFVLWLLGMITSFGGPLIHLLLAIAVIVFLVKLISGGRTTV
ncbi:MAG TPA: lmo0937 family membrane protein [Candidatus Krumholzibacteria bacterium]